MRSRTRSNRLRGGWRRASRCSRWATRSTTERTSARWSPRPRLHASAGGSTRPPPAGRHRGRWDAVRSDPVTDAGDAAAAPGMRVVDQEVFGPVAVRSSSTAATTRRSDWPTRRRSGCSSGSSPGPSSGRSDRSRQLESGSVIVNRSSNYRLDSFVYGGVKQSGVGREDPRSTLRELTEEHFACWGTGREVGPRWVMRRTSAAARHGHPRSPPRPPTAYSSRGLPLDEAIGATLVRGRRVPALDRSRGIARGARRPRRLPGRRGRSRAAGAVGDRRLGPWPPREPAGCRPWPRASWRSGRSTARW